MGGEEKGVEGMRSGRWARVTNMRESNNLKLVTPSHPEATWACDLGLRQSDY